MTLLRSATGKGGRGKERAGRLRKNSRLSKKKKRGRGRAHNKKEKNKSSLSGSSWRGGGGTVMKPFRRTAGGCRKEEKGKKKSVWSSAFRQRSRQKEKRKSLSPRRKEGGEGGEVATPSEMGGRGGTAYLSYKTRKKKKKGDMANIRRRLLANPRV